MSLLDRHIDIEKLTETMTDSEKRAYELGRIQSVQTLLNELGQSKVNISSTLLDRQEEGILSAGDKLELQSRLHILDVYSKYYAVHLDSLTKEFIL